MKKLHFISQNRREACGLNPIKIHFSDYPNRINEDCVFFNKISHIDVYPRSDSTELAAAVLIASAM